MYIIYKVGSSENVINTEAEKVLIYIFYLEMSNISIDITKIRSHDYLELNTPTITRIYFIHFYTTFNYIYYFFYFFSDLLGYTLRLFYYIYTRPFYINFNWSTPEMTRFTCTISKGKLLTISTCENTGAANLYLRKLSTKPKGQHYLFVENLANKRKHT